MVEARGKGAAASQQGTRRASVAPRASGAVGGAAGVGGDTHIGVRAAVGLVLLDPRAVVTRDGLVIHDPRRAVALPAWARAWLAAHPEWPRVATEAVGS